METLTVGEFTVVLLKSLWWMWAFAILCLFAEPVYYIVVKVFEYAHILAKKMRPKPRKYRLYRESPARTSIRERIRIA